MFWHFQFQLVRKCQITSWSWLKYRLSTNFTAPLTKKCFDASRCRIVRYKHSYVWKFLYLFDDSASVRANAVIQTKIELLDGNCVYDVIKINTRLPVCMGTFNVSKQREFNFLLPDSNVYRFTRKYTELGKPFCVHMFLCCFVFKIDEFS